MNPRETFQPPPPAGPVPNPIFADFRKTYATCAANRLNPSPHWRGAKGSADMMRDLLDKRQRAAIVELGRQIALERGEMMPFVWASNGRIPDFLMPVYQWWDPHALLDHLLWFRRWGSRGPSCKRNTIAVGQPYLADEQVPAALAHWTERLKDEHGLAVRQLRKDWLTHAPDNEAAQIFLVGHDDLIRLPPAGVAETT